jgi:hypothetical protein
MTVRFDQQPSVLLSQNKSASPTSQTNTLLVCLRVLRKKMKWKEKDVGESQHIKSLEASVHVFDQVTQGWWCCLKSELVPGPAGRPF